MKECAGCSKPLSLKNKTGHCIACGNRARWNDPEFRQRRLEGIRKKFADPFYYRAVQLRCRKMGREAALDPVLRERRIAEGKAHYRERLFQPAVRERCLERVREANKRYLAWCPKERVEEYQMLRKRIGAVKARRQIEDAIREERRRELAALSPFERQLRALENGAPLIANDQRPSLANPGVYGERAA